MKKEGQSICAIALFLLAFAILSPAAHADSGGYTIVTSPGPGDIVDDSGADGTWSFWQLPLWIQVSCVTGAVVSLLVALKLVPFFLLKLKRKPENANRDAIYRFIEENPGCTANDISRDEKLNLGSVRYHVYRLELARKIREVRTGKFVRLFRNNHAYSEREIIVISALNIRTNRAIVSLLATDPGLPNKQIAERLQIKSSLAHVYLSQLMKDQIVRFEKNERQKEYFLENDIPGIVEKAGIRLQARYSN